jgi:putative cardiolipin synthase
MTGPPKTTVGRWWRRARIAVRCIAVLAAAWLLLKFMFRLPPLEPRVDSKAIEQSADTRLGRALAASISANPGSSGILALADGRDAFAARALLAAAADRTLDIQYYIWHNDTSGGLLFDALRRAADRGVRVRLLLDDNNTTGLDEVLGALDRHPNIEVRLFNPFRRPGRFLGYIVDFSRVNRRMHNKSFTADNQATIVGGRNVADEYFGATSDRTFLDLDVLAIGPVVQEVSHDFDRYWASSSAYPASQILPPIGAEAISRVDAEAGATARSTAAEPYLRAVAGLPFVRELMEGTLKLEWARTVMLSDDPAKGLGQARDEALLWPQMKAALGPPRRTLGLVSAYFVPTRSGVDAFVALARQGVKVRVLTNSLEATDMAVVHAGYAKHRRALLAAGVELFELKRAFADKSPRDGGLTGSSGTSLHAKTFTVDGARVFVGSFNFDPRSASLNTELGFVIESAAMAHAVAQSFVAEIPTRAYEVRLGAKGSLEWVEHVDGRPLVHTTEPGSGVWRRALVWFFSKLPIDWLL